MIALLIDIGNTRIKWRVAQLDGPDANTTPQWVTEEQAIRLDDVDDLEAAFRGLPDAAVNAVDLVFIANVASEAAGRVVQHAASSVWPAGVVRFVRSTASAGALVNGYRDPLQLGVDRWLAAVAAHALCPDRSVLVCTFGTATTIDLVEHHRFVGGLILPGIDAMHRVLTSSTARLPALAGQVKDFGDRTEDAIASGVMVAQIGAVERTLRKLHDRAGPSQGPQETMCIVAGGAAGRIAALLDELDTPFRVIHDLVLRGLALMARDAIASTVASTQPS